MKELRHFCLFLAVLICSLQYSIGIDAPDNVAVSNEGSTDSLKVTWAAPDGATSQEVTWSLPEGLGSSGNISGTANEHNITGLTPGTLYDVTVTAFDGADENSTDPVEGRTKPSPANLMESGATNESISASWTKPDGVVDQYLVSCSNGTVEPNSPIMDEDTTTTYNASCVGLSTAGANYTITVTSQSGSEKSSESPITITALPNSVNLMEGTSTVNSVSATWRKPDGEVDMYDVQCSNGTVVLPTEDQPGSFSASCENLPTPGDLYSMNVTSLSSEQRSDVATINLRANPNSVVLRADDITTRQITVLWDDPDGVEDSFNVDCTDDGSTDITLYPGDASNEIFQATCNVTMAGADYNITVTSVSGDKQSPVTETFISAIPEQVAVEETSSNTTSITVSWNAFPSANGFEVDCSNGISVPSSPLPGSATQVTCDGVTAGGNHSVSIVTVENNGRSPEVVTYVVAVPEAAVDLTEVSATTRSISASWSNATGVFDYYNVSCSDGSPLPAQVYPSNELAASCTGLPTPGDDYDISVTTVSNGLYSETDTITITALPDAVKLVEGPSNNTAISARWTIEGVVDTFTITCSNGTAFPSSIPVESSPTNKTFIAYCTDLPTPGLEYNISVVAISKNKSGAIRTEGVHASPSGIVLEEGPSTTTSVSATWMNPEGAVEHYEIACSKGTASPYNITDTTQLSYSASCVNLSTPGDTYTMTVYSFVDSGMTNSSSSINLIALPAMVTDLMELGATSDSVSANWTKPEGMVTNYTVICPDGSTQTIQENNDNSTHMVTCDGLQTAGAEYNVTVIAVSGNKASAPATVNITAYPNSVDLRAGEITTRQITVLWNDPDGFEDSFIVDCGSDGSSDLILYPGDASNGMSFQATCNATMAGAPYNITVTSVSGDKESPATSSFIAATPNAVTIVDSSSNTTSITVSWNALSSADGFNVSCSDGDPSPPSLLPGSATRATCEGVTSGGNHSVTVITLENNGRSPATVTYVAAVPLSADLVASASTTTSVSAMWPYPGGLVDVFEVFCSNGTESNATLVVGPTDLDTSYLVRCDDVYNPGDNYTMMVTSVSYEEENSAIIVLTALPLSVQLVSSNATTTSVSATWEFPGGIVDEFEVECSNGTENFPSADSDEGYRASCEGLENPGDNYTMTVSSLSNLQRNSALIVLTALPEAVNLTEVSASVTTSSISATWAMPNGIVEYYNVSCPVGNPSPARVYPSDDLTASCVNLTIPGANYDISVTTISSGQRSETDTITITALPESVTLVRGASNATAISARWTLDLSLNMVDTFNITCSNGTASPPSIDVNSNPTQQDFRAYCTELEMAGVEYFLSVVAISKGKESAVSSVGVYALPNGVVLNEGNSTTTSVSATWMPPDGTVESYTIDCSEGDADPSTITVASQASYLASCVNLTGPGATYTMTVYSEVGTDGARTSRSFIELVAVPESVENVTVIGYTTTTVNVEWQLKVCSGCVYNHFNLTFEPNSQDPITVDYTNGVTQYSSQVSGLTQGRSFNFTVVSVSGVGVEGVAQKTSEEQSVEQRTVPATPHGLNISPTQTTLSLNWSYVGDADDFAITIMPSHGTAVFNGDLTNPAGEVTGLTPGTEYNVSVVTISGDERSEPQTEGTRTLPDKPSPVQNPMAYVVDKNTIRLQYESPASPNGIIVSYIISYIGTRDNLQDHEFTYDYGPVLTVTVEGLYPGYSYIFTIIAVNDGGFESNPVSTESVTTPEEEPPPVPEDYPYIENTVHSERLTTRFTVELPRDLFSHENGELMTFSVIITTQANDADVQSTERTYNDRSQGAYITIFRMPYPYPPSFESSRRRRATESNVLVVIGNETCSGSSSEYCNGPLNDNTRYYYAFRAYNSRGSTTSDTFGPVNTVKDNTTGIAVGVSMSLFAIIFVIAVGAFVTMRRRKRNTCNSQRPSLEGNENRGFIPPGDDQEMRKMKRKPGSSMYRKSHSKPVLLTNFEDHYRRMKADSDFKFTEEYDEIRQVGKGQPIVAALEMVNRAKNRFTNILPYEHSRVKLAALADEPDTDYINANYMPGYGGPREFIACQGPLPGTVDDMWRMIWEKNTSIVVMLTQLVEMGKIKCHQYWPENYNPVTYGTIEVTMQAVQQFDHWVIREFTIVKGDDIRKLTQYHFMSWPDHGVPNQTSFMLDFVRTVREAIQKVNSENPTVVHCSAGVGRTGTYIALDRLMQMMQEHDFVDIFGIICEMRMQRNLMVQTEKQYIFIHECVMDLLRREDGDTGESIYVNFNANGYNGDVSKNLLDQAV